MAYHGTGYGSSIALCTGVVDRHVYSQRNLHSVVFLVVLVRHYSHVFFLRGFDLYTTSRSSAVGYSDGLG